MAGVEGAKAFTVNDFVKVAEQLDKAQMDDKAVKLGSHELHVVGKFNRSSTLFQTRAQFAHALAGAFGRDNAAVIECKSLLLSAEVAKKPLSARTILDMTKKCRESSELELTGERLYADAIVEDLKELRNNAAGLAVKELKKFAGDSPSFESLKGELLQEIDREIGSIKIKDAREGQTYEGGIWHYSTSYFPTESQVADNAFGKVMGNELARRWSAGDVSEADIKRLESGNLTSADVRALNKNPTVGHPVHVKYPADIQRLAESCQHDRVLKHRNNDSLDGLKTFLPRKYSYSFGGKTFQVPTHEPLENLPEKDRPAEQIRRNAERTEILEAMCQEVKNLFGEKDAPLLNMFDELFYNTLTNYSHGHIQTDNVAVETGGGGHFDALNGLSITKGENGSYHVECFNRVQGAPDYLAVDKEGNSHYYQAKPDGDAQSSWEFKMSFDMKLSDDGKSIEVKSDSVPTLDFNISAEGYKRIC